ncbi:glycosyltransferase [Marinobacter confluentis]|uniref:Glycosyltransferase n=1 Tax=Marinobacter confluentis TaxID=1697557 RepID=A0A4Z1C8S5_9GAMM|nr:glycosyltransferase [Marinobacter confluentis]TGN39973.1 glycosyltransferase [Marinobacter confluentis]
MNRNYKDIKLIFHHPRPIKENGTSGSEVRPYKMLKAFKNLGASVVEVTGTINERKSKMKQVRKRLDEGEIFDFVYAENLTIPYAMSESHRLPLNPFIDHKFLDFCSSKGIPVALFNRDVYWRDSSYREMLPWWGRAITVPLYWFDWLYHTRYLSTLYLPSEAMARVLPYIEKFKKLRYLPPGTEIFDDSPETKNAKTFRVFYVGGIKPPTYNLRPLFKAIGQAKSNITLTVCCREKEWEEVKSHYLPYVTDSIKILHRSGSEIPSLYNQSDLFSIVRSDGSYLERSVPIKVYESIGFALPILCSPGGETARIVGEENLGWVESEEKIAHFLEKLSKNPAMLEEKRKHLKTIRRKHTWEARAIQVCEEMLVKN